MTMLSTQEIAAMRATAETSLPGTAIVQTFTVTDDGGGGGTAAWSTAGTVACRIAPLNGSEREIADRIAQDAESIVTLPAETSISTSNRMVISGGTFNVLAIRDRNEWEITRRVEVGQQV